MMKCDLDGDLSELIFLDDQRNATVFFLQGHLRSNATAQRPERERERER